jgi:hypothetical protein
MAVTMAKSRKVPQTADDSVSRKQEVTAEELKSMADALSRYAGVLAGVHKQMTESEIGSLQVLGVSTWRRGVELLDRFSLNVETSLRSAKRSRGLW